MSIIDMPIVASTATNKDIHIYEPAADDVEVNDLVFQITKQNDIDVKEIWVGGDIERTMEGASTLTLTLYDKKWKLENSGAFDNAIDIQVDQMWFRLFTIKYSGYFADLTFIDRDIAYLMEHDKPRRASRAQMTRLEFCYWLVRAVKKHKIPVVCPELHIKQPIKAPDSDEIITSSKESWNDRQRGQGFGPGADIKVKKVPATSAQKRAIATVLREGLRQKLDDKLLIAAVMVITQESVAGKIRHSNITLNRGPNTGPWRYIGLFHQDSSIGSVWRKLGGGSNNDQKDARAFFKTAKGLYDDDNKIPVATLCLQVQRPGGGPEQYGQWKSEAEDTVSQFSGEAPSEDRTIRQRYMFSTKDDSGKRQNWTAIGRLLSEVHFARFMSNGTLYMISEKRLLKSRIRMRLTRDTPGIHAIDYEMNDNHKVSRATIACRADRWVAPPGTCVQLVNCGRASEGQGRWLVSSIRRPLGSRDTEIELKKPTKKLKEPAPDVITISRDTSSQEGGRLQGGGPIAQMYREAQRIHSKHYPYVWGGGHAHCGKPDRGDGSDPGIGYDCSGSTAAVVAAGLGDIRRQPAHGSYIFKNDPVPSSGWMAQNYMSPGEGEFMTIWANGVHVWIEFKLKKIAGKRKAEHFGTGDWGKGWRGPGFNKNMHPKAGFTPRHFPGW
jgi:hypothetical protein